MQITILDYICQFKDHTDKVSPNRYEYVIDILNVSGAPECRTYVPRALLFRMINADHEVRDNCSSIVGRTFTI